MLKWAFFATFATVFGIGIYLFFYLGGYKDVAIQETNYASLNLVYREHNGPYHQIGPVIEMVEKWAKRVGIKCERTFGEYLDDPAKVEESRLRAIGGCVVNQDVTDLPEDFFFRSIQARPVLKAEFRGAPSIGPFKVYPKAMDHIASHRLKMAGPPLEIYQSLPDGEYLTEFLFPLEKRPTTVDQ